MTQRWRERRESYRPAADERFEPARHEVQPIDELTAKGFVVQHHYSASYPAARLRFGLFDVHGLVGAAVFSVPCQPRVVPRWLGVEAAAGVELGRFVLLDDVRRNGESWFLGQCFQWMRTHRPDLQGVVSYADPVERLTAEGRIVKPGHMGIIYQAHNGVFQGRGSARTLTLAPDGSVISQRSLSKIRLGERGAGYAYAQLMNHGVRPKQTSESWRGYVRTVLHDGSVRRFRHPGNFVYTWGLNKQVHRMLRPLNQPYPKGPGALCGITAA